MNVGGKTLCRLILISASVNSTYGVFLSRSKASSSFLLNFFMLSFEFVKTSNLFGNITETRESNILNLLLSL